MGEKVCKHCKRKVSGSHDCPSVGRNIPADSSTDFLSTYVATSIISGSDDGPSGGCGSSGSGGFDGGGCGGGGD